MTSSPLVTIIVPNYNHLEFLPERFDSIFSQTFKDFEIIIFDDASTDQSVDYLQEIAQNKNVQLIVNKKNGGSPFAQWNRGVELARGKYVWIAESDDTAEPDFLQELVSSLEQNENIGIATTNLNYIDEQGNIAGKMTHDAFQKNTESDRWETNYQNNGLDEVRNYLYLQNTIPSASAVLFRRSVYLKAGSANESFQLSGDWWQWAKMLAYCDIFYSAKPLAGSRIHSATLRRSTQNDGRYELDSLQVQRKMNQMLDIEREMISRGANRYATSWIQSVRSGRYQGSLLSHGKMFSSLFRLDKKVAIQYLLQLPYCILIWGIKKTINRGHCSA